MKPIIVVTHPLIEGGLDILKKDHEIRVLSECSLGQLKKALSDASALITLLSVKIDAEILAAAPNLKIIANYAAGYDNVDVAAASRHKIFVTNTPNVLAEATADLTWAAMLSLVRRVVPGDQMVRAGKFTGWGATLLLGNDFVDKTLGVVGFGQIGRAVARRAAGFNLKVVFYDIAGKTDVDLGLVQARCLPLNDVLKQADFVSLHTPLTPETKHLLDAERLKLLKPTAYLINTARGPVVDEKALVELLQQRRLAGAAFDVYENEPALTEGLAQLPNVVLLPHLGSATVETRMAMAQMVATNVRTALQGMTPPQALNAEEVIGSAYEA